MATFDQLSAEQRAIIELVLRRGQTYGQLADTLGMPEGRVRELARDALVELAPITARRVEQDWRGQLADYVLGQQAGPESTATRGHLRRSEAARAWARSLLDSLDGLYGNGDMPSIPDGERAAARERRRPRPEPAPAAEPGEERGPLSPAAAAAVRRRRLLAGAGAAALVILVAVLLWPVGLLTGGDDGGGGGGKAGAAQGRNAASSTPAGIAIVAAQGSQRGVLVQAANLAPSGQGDAYEVWFYNSPRDATPIAVQRADANGRLQTAGPLPRDYAKFRYIDVSRQSVKASGRTHSGRSVLRGRLGKLRRPSKTAKKHQAQTLGQAVLTPPR